MFEYVPPAPSASGMTKREFFAAMAMQGLLAASTSAYPPNSDTAKRALRYADALIAELEKDPESP